MNITKIINYIKEKNWIALITFLLGFLGGGGGVMVYDAQDTSTHERWFEVKELGENVEVCLTDKWRIAPGAEISFVWSFYDSVRVKLSDTTISSSCVILPSNTEYLQLIINRSFNGQPMGWEKYYKPTPIE